MSLAFIDWFIIVLYFIFSLVVGLWASKKAGENRENFFLAGRNMPWWLLGISMVATTFSTDTPNLVTDLVRQNGVSANWGWWSFLLTGMLTTFIYSKLWHRSGVLTDIEFYELRYSGKAAAFLRAFRAFYLGFIFNVLVMGAVSLAAVKFGEIILNIPGWITLFIACSITLVYSMLGGLKAVVITDFIQFLLAMVGSILSFIYIVNLESVGGLHNLINHPNVISKIALFPDMSNPDVWVPVLFVPLAVQWWASYYPGAEPGGGGYIAQRMLSAKNENNAFAAALLFNITHYALRPWPWIIIGLSSLIIFPDLENIQSAFPTLSLDKLGNDVAYPAMLTLLPTGLLGLVSASLIAAFMSTMSTQVNLGASYLVNDFYHRFINPNASEAELIKVARLFTIISLLLGSLLGLVLTNASQAFSLLLLLGSGTGLIYILRWFWWRINAYTEIIAMVSSLIISIYLTFIHDTLNVFPFLGWQKLILGSLSTTFIWLVVTFITPPDNEKVLQKFVDKVNPGGPGWANFKSSSSPWPIPRGILCMILGCFAVYGILIGTGQLIYGQVNLFIIAFLVSFISSVCIFKLQKTI